MLPTTRPTTTPTPHAERDPLREFEQATRELTDWARSWRWPDLGGAFAALGDLEETDDAFVLEVDLPGVDKRDVDIQLDDRRLTITAERKERERVGILRRRTRRIGTYRHEVVLPSDVDPDGIEAHLADGELVVRLPRSPATRRHRIPVR